METPAAFVAANLKGLELLLIIGVVAAAESPGEDTPEPLTRIGGGAGDVEDGHG